MPWCDATPVGDDLERARAVKGYAQRLVRAMQRGEVIPVQQTVPVLRALSDLPTDDFSPAQRRVLNALEVRLKRYVRAQLAGYVQKHHRKPPGPVKRLTALPIQGWEADEDGELGILPALPAILGAAAPLLQGIMGGGKKDEPAPAPAPAGPSIIMPPSSGSGAGSGVTLPAIGGVIADQIRAVPPPVRQQVIDALREANDRYRSGQMDAVQLMNDIKAQLGPTIKSQLESVSNAALQRQATFEHESLKARDKRWKQSADAQKAIMARINDMEARFGSALVSAANRRNAIAKGFGIPPRYQG